MKDMMFDTIERVGDSVVHHGTLNDRVYLKEVHEEDLGSLIAKVQHLVAKKHYGKIVSKVPRWALDTFLEQGYRVEAEIPGLYNGATDGYFLAGYPKKERVQRTEKEERFIESVKTIALATSDVSPKVASDGYVVRRLEEEDLPDLARLNQRAFPTYPYPIYEAAYLSDCLQRDFEFFGLYKDNRLLEAALVNIEAEGANAEIVDFAILPDLKGQNLSYHLLGAIKKEVAEKQIRTLYAGARATSYGLNITFKKQGFRYGGTLVNNTWVGGCMESMNIWYA